MAGRRIDGVGCRGLETALIGACAGQLAKRLQAGVHWHAHARSGMNTRAIRTGLLPADELGKADFVVISCGVNDVTSLTGPAVSTRTGRCDRRCLAGAAQSSSRGDRRARLISLR